MPLTDRVLMGPGPCNPYPEAVEALARPMLGHLDPDFVALLDETCDRLRTVFRTDQRHDPAGVGHRLGRDGGRVRQPGAAGRPGGGRASTACSAPACATWPAGAAPRSWPSRRPGASRSTPSALLAAHPDPRIIAVVHAETSTGVRSDIAPLGEGKGDALLLVDCVTSLGGIEVDVDGWGVDVAYAGTQKCLGVPPGLAPADGERPGPRPARRAQPELVPRPADDRPLHRPGHRRPHLPPHRPGLDDHVAARRPRRPAGRGPRRRRRPPRRVRPAAAGRPGRRWASSCSPPRATACPS